jgi:ADP-ribosylglycohydrolase
MQSLMSSVDLMPKVNGDTSIKPEDTLGSPRINQLADKARGCILGGAIGDSMGGPFEGQPGPLTFRAHSDWRISDDTQLTLATCESIIEIVQVSPEHIASRFVEWYRARRITGIGSSTLKALRDLDAGAHWALAGARGEMSAGNGAAMRIAPLAFHLDPELAQDRQIIRDVCRITHHNEEACIGALAIAVAIRSVAFNQIAPTQLLDVVVRDLPDSRVRDRILLISALRGDLSVAEVASEFGSSGYVADSVPLALYAAQLIERFPLDEVLRSAIEAGGDTDTIASMTGQMAGAWLGASQVPRGLIDMLPNANYIEQVTGEFAATLRDYI